MVAGELLTAEMAVRDELTGVASRKSFVALATKALQEAKAKTLTSNASRLHFRQKSF